jgi:hypothetical protein
VLMCGLPASGKGDLFGFGLPTPTPFCEPVPSGLAGLSV